MSSARLVLRSFRAAPRVVRPFSSATVRFAEHESRIHDNIDVYRKHQMEKPLNPHLTNTTSTIANEMPSIGKDNAPPEMITNVDPGFVAKDSVPENTERMTGGTQDGNPESGVNADLKVGELEESSFRVEPLRRTGEDTNTTRARLLYQSRKRGTLESDLLMSTFADRYLETMSPKQLQQYDLFLDENDWDIYYWATQEPTPTSMEYAEGGGPDQATPVAQGKPAKDEHVRPPGTGEWAQTVGLFKPAYRPVPQRWKNSEVLAMLRQHVKDRSAGGVLIGDTSGEAEPDSKSGQGMAFMPELKNLDK